MGLTVPQLDLFPTPPQSRKDSGAYYTPDHVVWSLVRWAVRSESDLLLDPACGDGRFIAAHPRSVGVERDCQAAATAARRSPSSRVHTSDFFDWAEDTPERFDCAAGNPPFIRYQTFNGEVRERALRLSAKLGAEFTGLTASWAPFLVVTASLLRPGGRFAFVVPAAIGHAPYAAPLLEYLIRNFETVQVVAVREKLFPELSEDCWLLYADGRGATTEQIRLSAVDWFQLSSEPPRQAVSVPATEWRRLWNRRLRPYLLNENVRDLYQSIASWEDSSRFGELASIGIGYVSGANRFFHLRPSEAERWSIPPRFLLPTVRNGKVLPDRDLTDRTVEQWQRRDEPMMLLRVPRNAELAPGVAKYLATEDGRQARQAYKCRMRTPWYSVPDVKIPDFFLTYMSGRAPSLVRNSAAATCTNAIHGVRVHRRRDVDLIIGRWSSPFVRLSCELEGHPLGGGMLKLDARLRGSCCHPPRRYRQRHSLNLTRRSRRCKRGATTPGRVWIEGARYVSVGEPERRGRRREHHQQRTHRTARNDLAIADSGRPVESIVRFHAALCALTARQGIRDDVSRYEAVSMGLIDVRNHKVGQPLSDFPPPDSPLLLERFFDTLYQRYDERYVYSAPDLSSRTRRSEWSSASPAFDSPLASSMDYEIRLDPGAP